MSSAADRAARHARAWLAGRFPGVEPEPLRQEASARRYWRLPGTGFVLMVREDAFLADCDPYCRATELFEELGLRVPRIEATIGPLGLVLLEDCGDELLADEIEGATPDEVGAAVEEAAGLLEPLRRGTGRLRADHAAFWERLGPRRLAWELRFFHRWWVEEMSGAELSAEETGRLHRFYDELAREVWISAPPVLCHRDLHSRNLMRAPSGELVVLDHQDARIGPGFYDLASLCRDPYLPAELPGGLEDEAVRSWGERLGLDAEAARAAYERTALQRNLKAAGTYACQVTAHGREIFRPSLEPTLRHARRALERLPEHDEARQILHAHELIPAADRSATGPNPDHS